MNITKPRELLLGGVALLVCYIVVLFIWLQIKDVYHLFFIHNLVEPLIGYYEFKIQSTHWATDNYNAKLVYNQFIELIPKQSAVELNMPFLFKLGDIPSFSTFATPISLTFVLVYIFLKRTKESFKIALEVILILVVTHIVIFTLMSLLKIDSYYTVIIDKFTQSGYPDAVSKPFPSWFFDTVYYINGFLIKIVIRIEPLLIALYIFFKDSCSFKLFK